MSAYELMYIVKPELDDQAVQQEIDKVGQLIQTNGGQVKKVTPWGKRRLAYSVKDQREGHYVVEEFDLDQAKVQEVEGSSPPPTRRSSRVERSSQLAASLRLNNMILLRFDDRIAVV